MIYFDNAATSYQKPYEVYRAVFNNMMNFGANAGRGGHFLSIRAGEIITEARETLCEFFGIDNIERLAFFQNATYALNAGLKGVLDYGDHVVTTSMEHNSVIRPLAELKRQGKIDYTKAQANIDGELNIREIERAIRKSTRLIVMTHASNVCGNIYDIEKVYKLAQENKILFLLDASQSAGVLDVGANMADMIAFSGHKGLLGAQGTGGLFVKEKINLKTIIEGGTGSVSENLYQPQFMPDRLECGTQNMPAISSLTESVKFILKEGRENILNHERELAKYFVDEIKNIKGIKIYGTKSNEKVGVVSINLAEKDPNKVAEELSSSYGIAVRSGLHCAPEAHRTLGTIKSGTIRFSFGYFNKKQEIDKALYALLKISKNKNE